MAKSKVVPVISNMTINTKSTTKSTRASTNAHQYLPFWFFIENKTAVKIPMSEKNMSGFRI